MINAANSRTPQPRRTRKMGVIAILLGRVDRLLAEFWKLGKLGVRCLEVGPGQPVQLGERLVVFACLRKAKLETVLVRAKCHASQRTIPSPSPSPSPRMGKGEGGFFFHRPAYHALAFKHPCGAESMRGGAPSA